ncbi:MAG TPA: N-acetylmuramoyl-L-alanine amidase [Thermoleophilaceae bacterium]|nr:N-acetylmuramoyl-L-alanine amidase [Thermoleophilaceae bacterium]
MSLIATTLAVVGGLVGPPATPAAAPGERVIGRSTEGRPIRAVRVGSPRARVKMLVVGAMHGNEPAGRAVVDRLRRLEPPRGTALWLIEDANPDGSAAGTRHNAAGVDLNRNFPYRWRHQDGVYESGPGPASEPETQAIQRFVERERPRITLWYHQALRMVVKSTGDAKLERLYSRRSGLPRRRLPRYHGTAVSWQNTSFRGDTAFVVELPAGPLPPAGVRRHARATLALAKAVAPPRIVSRPIPYDAKRKADMRAYARRHYGIDDHRLRDPKVIVQHYTVTDTFEPVYNTFAPNRPDAELGELPGVCTHYVIDRDGTIYQLVSTRIMCRHTVGLNYTAIGIEHVGRSDAQVMGNPRQMAASLRLTRMLQGRHGIVTRNVIGHNENRDSRFHRERVARLRTQTHGDFPKPVMDVYRRRLERLPAPASLR